MLTSYAQQTMVDTLPIAACVFTGKEYCISAANEQMLAIWKKDPGIIGKELITVIPELKDQQFFEMLKDVYHSGHLHNDREFETELLVNGEAQLIYLDHSFKPLRDKNGIIYGIVGTAIDVTARVLALKGLKESVEELSALNEEYSALNEELEAGSEELRVTNEELLETKEQLERTIAELSDAEERLLAVAHTVNIGLFEIDLTSQEIITSKRFDEIFGSNNPEKLSVYRQTIHPADRPIREYALKKALDTGHLFYEVRLLRKDDSIIWIRAEGKVFYGTDRAPIRIIGTVLDFTDRHHDKEVQRKLKSLADNSADLMALLELDGTNSYINEAGKKLLGFRDDQEVMNTPISKLHTAEDFIQVEEQVLPSVMAEGKWIGSMRVRHLKSGEVFPVMNFTIRIDDPFTGRPIGIGAIMRDLRPEEASKKALADSELLLKNVTSAAPTALWMADKTGDFTYVNQTWRDWTGRSQSQSSGMGWLDAVIAEDRDRVTGVYQNALSNKISFELEYRIKNFEGQVRWLMANGHPQFDSVSNFSGFVGACVDITTQKEVQQHKDDFISIASHELKTPITSLKATIQLLNKIDIGTTNPMVSKLLVQAGKSVERVSHLIDDLLNVGRLEQKQLQLVKANFILFELLNACANPIALSSRKKIQIYGDTDVQVFADEHRIDQVVSNLISNAVKYAPECENFEVKISKFEDAVKVEIVDKGPGIPKDRLKDLFKRYYRVENTSQSISGLGLGLFICKEIIERHGGQIGAESELGTGSNFWFTLPLK